MPSYKQPNNKVKIPAAWLIEQCNLKGTCHKGAAVHINQPLVLINKSSANGRDILELSELIKEKVKRRFDILLEPEVRIL